MSTIIACAACNHRFEAGGYRDEQCPACGTLALRARLCPRCGDNLAGQRVEKIVVDVCARCHGAFVDHQSLEHMVSAEDRKRIDAWLAALPAATQSVDGAPIATCPTCELAMDKKLSSTGAGVIIDVCVPHGVFFDPGELKRLVTFVQRERREEAERREADQRHADARSRAERIVLGVAGDVVDAIAGFLERIRDVR
jgi:Zn-finger nucleic acid-binding protein